MQVAKTHEGNTQIKFTSSAADTSRRREATSIEEQDSAKVTSSDAEATRNINDFSNDVLIPESLFLENRVDNCDSAIVFMKHVIKPGRTGLNGFKVIGESEKFLAQNQLVDKYFIVPNNQRFYISIECLIGKNIETVFDIFAKPKFHAYLLKKYNSKEKFVLYMRGYNSFVSFYLIGRNGVINKVEYEYTHRVH